ncbi:uncharacterized protein LOC106174236 [Lingula anatina]|uniref:Uncharacterized protein LOC106174236 n=1 Tax=Lingula anatina TaxID=7574 RepID=A0A1S3JMK4_LINAN|nr:uncharacterized protein LOC106174236 [Lingula anatina]|eukprot:XP_013411144.1 uncharacterized protein LOC106174236 [Lingula anatina]
MEVRRLKEGFKESVGNSEVRRTFLELRKMVGTPDWQRATYWEYTSLSTMCCYCNKEFGLLQNRRHPCTVCGFMACGDCCSKDLIVYIPNEEKGSKDPEPRIAVIKIVGCPEREPDMCVYLRICSQCHLYLEEKQVQKMQQTLTDQLQKTELFWTKIVEAAKKLSRIRAKISAHLPKYQEHINTMGIDSGAPRASLQGENGIQVLARAQCDMSDLFVTFVLAVESIRGIKPSTTQQTTVLKNLVRGNYNFYQETVFLFRELRKTLEDTTLTSADILETIQKFVDRNAMRAVYVFLKQLALESLMLCDNFTLNNTVPVQFAEAEEVVCQDLKQCIKDCKDDWAESEEDINNVLKDQIQNHRVIKLPKTRRSSQQQVTSNQKAEIEHVILHRSEEIVRKIMLQMADKCSESRCSASKEALASLYNWIYRELRKSQVTNHNREEQNNRNSGTAGRSEEWEFI